MMLPIHRCRAPLTLPEGSVSLAANEDPDQTALELLVEFQARYPGHYSMRQLYTLQKRVRRWRQQAVQRLVAELGQPTPTVSSLHSHLAGGNIFAEAPGNKIT